ncbi:MAG: NTP transferase domain-containing protein [Candidatus Methanomethylophilaceae archaeon]|nr:NTP transferase domain-containing protein [Candidatus Methanomethylophilaceae archaeon]
MQALINAGGKGTRLNQQGLEKPMLEVAGIPVIQRVIDALLLSECVHEVVVSVSPNTRETSDYLVSKGIKVVQTSGEDFMGDMHQALQQMRGRMVLVCPSDLPLLTPAIVDELVQAHRERGEESTLALVAEDVVRETGGEPSYLLDHEGGRWSLSGMSIVDREKVLQDVFLQEAYLLTRHKELAVNVNTVQELELARRILKH